MIYHFLRSFAVCLFAVDIGAGGREVGLNRHIPSRKYQNTICVAMEIYIREERQTMMDKCEGVEKSGQQRFSKILGENSHPMKYKIVKFSMFHFPLCSCLLQNFVFFLYNLIWSFLEFSSQKISHYVIWKSGQWTP